MVKSLSCAWSLRGWLYKCLLHYQKSQIQDSSISDLRLSGILFSDLPLELLVLSLNSNVEVYVTCTMFQQLIHCHYTYIIDIIFEISGNII
jgi:hypothetical protein